MRAKLCKIAYKLGLRSLAYRIDLQKAKYLEEREHRELGEALASMAESAKKAAIAFQAAAAAYQQQYGVVKDNTKEEAQE